MPRQVDVRALVAPASDLDRLSEEDERRATEFTGRTKFSFIAVLVLVAGFLLLIAVITGFVSNEAENWALIGGFAVIVVVICAIILGLRSVVFGPREARRVRRFLLFCAANGLDTEPAKMGARWPGLMFPDGSERGTTTYRARWSENQRPVESATYSWATAGRTISSWEFAYVVFPCNSNYPHTLFENLVKMNFAWRQPFTQTLGPDLLANAPREDGRRYRLTADSSGRDPLVRRIFSDELVEILSDKKYPFNVEIVDGCFIAYFSYGQELDAGRWKAIFALSEAAVAAVSNKS
jgi:hypothetical protein